MFKNQVMSYFDLDFRYSIFSWIKNSYVFQRDNSILIFFFKCLSGREMIVVLKGASSLCAVREYLLLLLCAVWWIPVIRCHWHLNGWQLSRRNAALSKPKVTSKSIKYFRKLTVKYASHSKIHRICGDHVYTHYTSLLNLCRHTLSDEWKVFWLL